MKKIVLEIDCNDETCGSCEEQVNGLYDSSPGCRIFKTALAKNDRGLNFRCIKCKESEVKDESNS